MPRKLKYPKYDPAFCTLAREMGDKGATYDEIANAIGVPLRMLLKWERENREMFMALTPAYKAALMRRVVQQINERHQERMNKRTKRQELVDATQD